MRGTFTASAEVSPIALLIEGCARHATIRHGVFHAADFAPMNVVTLRHSVTCAAIAAYDSYSRQSRGGKTATRVRCFAFRPAAIRFYALSRILILRHMFSQIFIMSATCRYATRYRCADSKTGVTARIRQICRWRFH